MLDPWSIENEVVREAVLELLEQDLPADFLSLSALLSRKGTPVPAVELLTALEGETFWEKTDADV